jgi:hypothetical protein
VPEQRVRLIRAVGGRPRGKSGRGGDALEPCLRPRAASRSTTPPDGIRAVAICPGYVRTDLLEKFYDNQPDPDAARAS